MWGGGVDKIFCLHKTCLFHLEVTQHSPNCMFHFSSGQTSSVGAQVKFSHRTSVSWRVQVQLLPFGMYTEEVLDTLQETDVARLNFTWASVGIC